MWQTQKATPSFWLVTFQRVSVHPHGTRHSGLTQWKAERIYYQINRRDKYVRFLFLYRLGVILMVALHRMTLGISWQKREPYRYQVRAQKLHLQVASWSLLCSLFPVSLVQNLSKIKWDMPFSWLITCWPIKCRPGRTWEGWRKGQTLFCLLACTSPRFLVIKWLIKGTRGSYHKTNMNQRHSLIT